MNFSAPLLVLTQLSGIEYSQMSEPGGIYNIAVYMNMDLLSSDAGESLGYLYIVWLYFLCKLFTLHWIDLHITVVWLAWLLILCVSPRIQTRPNESDK